MTPWARWRQAREKIDAEIKTLDAQIRGYQELRSTFKLRMFREYTENGVLYFVNGGRMLDDRCRELENKQDQLRRDRSMITPWGRFLQLVSTEK